jgi:hypothetical protein
MRKFIFILFIASILITLLVAGNSYSTDTCDHTCSKCHQLTKEEALNLLKESIQDVKFLNTAVAGRNYGRLLSKQRTRRESLCRLFQEVCHLGFHLKLQNKVKSYAGKIH